MEAVAPGAHPEDSTALARWGRFTYRHRGAVLLVSLLLAAASLSTFSIGTDYLEQGKPLPSTEAGRAFLQIEEQIPASSEPGFLLIFSHATLNWDSPAFKQAVSDATADLAADPHVTSFVTPYILPPAQAAGMVSKDSHRMLVIVNVEGPNLAAQKVYPDLRALVHSDTLDITATGDLAFGQEINKVFEEDLPRAEMITFPVTLVVLLVVFGAVIAAFLPVLVGGLAVAGGLALTGLLSYVSDMPDWAPNLVGLIGLGVAIDYCLFIVSRFREEQRAGADRETALGRALATSGHAVLFSGLTVAVSLGGLVFFRGLEFADNGYGVAAAVFMAVLLSMTMLPAILAFLGHRLEWLPLRRRKPKVKKHGGFWHTIAGAVMDKPKRFTLAALAIVVLLALPVTQIEFGGFGTDQLPKSFESRQGVELLKEEFATQGPTDLNVVLDWGNQGPLSADHIDAAYRISRAIRQLPGVVAVHSLVDIDPSYTSADYQTMYDKPSDEWDAEAQRESVQTLGPNILVLKVSGSMDPADSDATELVKAIRAIPQPVGGKMHVTGMPALQHDNEQLILDKLPYAATFVVGSAFILLALQLRSLVLPLKAVVMNFLSVGASFGVVVFVFQMGYGVGLLGATPVALDAGNLVLMFCIIFGLSMDYEVLLMSRIREEYKRTGDNRKAVQEGLERNGQLITGAAVIMVLVFSAFGFMRITFMKVIGVGLAFAVLLDATLIRAILVPALMRLMGKANWWAPKWMKPTVPHVAGDSEPVDGPAPVVVQQPVAPATPARPTVTWTPVEPVFADEKVQAWFEAERKAKGKR